MATAQQDGTVNYHPRLELTEVESTLRRLLLDVAHYVKNSPTPPTADGQVTIPDTLQNEELVLRFTGGWVRDKLLGVGSHDIDVAINKLTGFQFGLRMKEYLEIPGNSEKYGLLDAKGKVAGALHKIEANPEKSKHLETVTTRIFGLDIDLVNLRKETYSEDSRNPQMEFGTPEEDALRRDATVNAMFYNLNTGEIEDFTGKGHEDMKAKIIRTPLEPYQTFKDDPLRVLRLIRFASRLGYTIEPEAEHQMSNPEIQDALQAKISRERVGVELEKMLTGSDPYMALSLIDRLGLYRTIFSDPTQNLEQHYQPDTEGWRLSIDTIRDILGSRDDVLPQVLVRNAEEEYLTWQVSCLVPYRDAPQPPPSAPGKKLPPPTASTVAREGIKATNKICEMITASIRNREEISKLAHGYAEQERRPHRETDGEDFGARDTLGMAIRRWGPSWKTQALFAALADIADAPESKDAILSDYTTFAAHLRDLNILEAYSLKPLIDGKALAKAMSVSPGPWMKDALEVIIAWQLRHPDKTNAEEAIEEVRNAGMHGELTHSLIAHFLRLTIRPLFAKNQHPAVTKQGRKVTTNVLPKKIELESSEDVSKPWKRDAHALGLLKWVLSSLDEVAVERDWPMIIPPLLSITDDHDPKFKAQGCEMIRLLLDVVPSSLLLRTGLGDVFEEALMPCLGYLPKLTPEEDSIALLSAAYPALIALSKTAFPRQPPAGSRLTAESLSQRRIKFLDTIVRKGVLSAYANADEYVKITEVLLKNLQLLNSELGIESVKHLKHVLPMLSEILSNPFGSTYAPTLLAAVKALQSVILNGWPRMAVHKAEVLKGLTLCWLKLDDNGAGELEVAIRKEMRETVQMLRAAVGSSECDLEADFDQLIEADGRLGGLLR